MTQTCPPNALRRAAGLALTLCLLAGSAAASAAPATQGAEPVVLAPARVGTAGQSRCGPAGLSTPGTNCLGFDGRDVRALPDLWVVGYENNRDLGEKHVLQTVAVFDLAPLRGRPDSARLKGHAHLQ